MSSVSGVGAGSAASSTPNAYESLTSDEFLRIMFAELTRQDPSKPAESKDLLEQIGIIRSIESDLSLTRRLEDITRQNEVASAGSLVGQFVEGTTDSGVRGRGFVDSVSVTREGISLNLSSGHTVPLSRIERVYDPALIQTQNQQDGTGSNSGSGSNSTGSNSQGSNSSS